MAEDNEIAEVGKFLTELSKQRRAKRVDRWNEGGKEKFRIFLKETFGCELIEYTPYHYAFFINGDIWYDYWPSNNTIRGRSWKGPSKHITFSRLCQFIASRHLPTPQTKETKHAKD